MRLRRSSGQSLVEFAFVLPMLTLFILGIIQLSLCFIMFYSETRMARETARWLAVHSRSTDDWASVPGAAPAPYVTAHVNETMLPGMVGGTVTLVQTGTATLPTIYKVGNMTVSFTPCLISASVCQHSNRAPGEVLFVEMKYDVQNVVFFPRTFGFGSLSTTLPTTLPPYRVSVMVE